MGNSMPKQFLELNGKPVALHSFDLFSRMSEFLEVVVVCPKEFQSLFLKKKLSCPLHFAPPGKERQDSLWNGLAKVSKTADFVCIHDAARPFVTAEVVQNVLQGGFEVGAAAAAMPITSTIKETDGKGFVVKTLNRSTLFEIQTPQVIHIPLLKQGFQKLKEQQVTVTDDVSLVELIGAPVKLVTGAKINQKLTTPEDLRDC